MLFRALSVACLIWSANCAAEFKVAVIDLQKAIFLTEEGKGAKNQIESEFKKRQIALQNMEASMKQMSEEFERKASVLAASAKEKQRLQLQSEWRKFQEAVASNQAEMEQLQQRLFEPMMRKMSRIVQRIATAEGLSLILDRSMRQVVFAAEALDVTDRAAKEYDKG